MKPAERMKQFPFNKAKHIVLVSYPGEIDSGFNEPDSVFIKIIKTNLDNIKRYGHPEKYKITKQKELSGQDIDYLSNLLINYTVRKNYKDNVISEIKCYIPRNGVIFYDGNGKIICFLEICFECMQYYISPKVGQINEMNHIEDFRYERIEYLQEIFKRNGFLVN